MFCPQCRVEYREGFSECADCQVPLSESLVDAQEQVSKGDLDVLIRTGCTSLVAIGLAKSLLREAGIPFFAMDQSPAARQEGGNILGWWDVRVPGDRQAEAREILQSVEKMK